MIRRTLAPVLGFATVLVLAVGGFAYSGVYNIAADEPHWPVTFKLIETLRERSIGARLDRVEVPDDLGDPERVTRGAGNYDAMCVGCHLKPGMGDSEIRKGLYPQPPDLTGLAGARSSDHGSGDTAAARHFWIIKHGIKASGMPAWAKGGMDDGAIWDMVALLQQLPGLSPGEYAALVANSPGHSHAGDDGSGHNRLEAHVDPPDAPPHSHAAPEQTEDDHPHKEHNHAH